MPSLVLSFVPQYSSHRVISGSYSHVSLFLRFTGATVVFFTFETISPAVAILSMRVISMDPVEDVVGRLGLVPFLASFEVIVAMDDCACASFVFFCLN